MEVVTVDEKCVNNSDLGASLIRRYKDLNPDLPVREDIELSGSSLERLQWLAKRQNISLLEAITKAITHEFFIQTEAIGGCEFYSVESYVWQKNLVFD